MLSDKAFTSKPKKENKQSKNSSSHLNHMNVSQRQPVFDKATEKTNTGLPSDLKTGIENLSGYSMDDVKVHRNSNKPAQLNAHAYAQGTDIHLAPGQEKHLPHEAWHVVQQKQGRVKPTMQMKDKVNVNDDSALEKEADVMGNKALLQMSMGEHSKLFMKKEATPVLQRVEFQKEFSGPALGTENELSSVRIFKTSSVQEIAVVQDDSKNDLIEITSDMVSPVVLEVQNGVSRDDQVKAVFSDYEPAYSITLDEGESHSFSENLKAYTIELITHPALAKNQDNTLSTEASDAWELRRKAFDFALDCIIAAGSKEDLKEKKLISTTKDGLNLVMRSGLSHIIQTSGTPTHSSAGFQATYSQASEKLDSDQHLTAPWLKADVSADIGNLEDLPNYTALVEEKKVSLNKAIDYTARIIKKVIAINAKLPLQVIDNKNAHQIHDPDVKNSWEMLPRTLVKDTVGHMIGADEASKKIYEAFVDKVSKKGEVEKTIVEKFILGSTGFARTTLSDLKVDNKGASAFEIRSDADRMHDYSVPKERLAKITAQWGKINFYSHLLLYKNEKPENFRYIYWDLKLGCVIYLKKEGEAKPKWYSYNPSTKEVKDGENPRVSQYKNEEVIAPEARKEPPSFEAIIGQL